MKKNENIHQLIDRITSGMMLPDEIQTLIKSKKLDKAEKELLMTALYLEKSADLVDMNNIQSAVDGVAVRMFDDFQRRKKNDLNGVLVYDSTSMPLPTGVRPALVDTKRLKFRINEMLVELSLYPINMETYELIGQFSGCDEKSLTIEAKSKKKKYTAATDQFDLFRFERIGRGDYKLTIKSGKTTIGIFDLTI